jgi:hypothetical protein
MDLRKLFRAINPPASKRDLEDLASLHQGRLPQSYLDFLTLGNGAESCINDREGDSLVLWSANEIAAMNDAYSIPRFLPEFLAIGSDGGDEAIGLDRCGANPEQWPIVRIGFGNFDRADFLQLATGFDDWQTLSFPMRPRTGQIELQYLAAAQQDRLDDLMAKNNDGKMTPAETEELRKLVREAEQITLINARTIAGKNSGLNKPE